MLYRYRLKEGFAKAISFIFKFEPSKKNENEWKQMKIKDRQLMLSKNTDIG